MSNNIFDRVNDFVNSDIENTRESEISRAAKINSMSDMEVEIELKRKGILGETDRGFSMFYGHDDADHKSIGVSDMPSHNTTCSVNRGSALPIAESSIACSMHSENATRFAKKHKRKHRSIRDSEAAMSLMCSVSRHPYVAMMFLFLGIYITISNNVIGSSGLNYTVGMLKEKFSENKATSEVIITQDPIVKVKLNGVNQYEELNDNSGIDDSVRIPYHVVSYGSYWNAGMSILSDKVVVDKLIDNIESLGGELDVVRDVDYTYAQITDGNIESVSITRDNIQYTSYIDIDDVTTHAVHEKKFQISSNLSKSARNAGIPKEVMDEIQRVSQLEGLGLDKVGAIDYFEIVYRVKKTWGDELKGYRVRSISKNGMQIWNNTGTSTLTAGEKAQENIG